MDIQGKLSGDVTNFGIKADNSNDGNKGLLDFDAAFDRKGAEEHFGAEFASAVFCGLRERVDEDEDGDATVYAFPFDTMSPPKWMLCGMHKVGVAGVATVDVQPEVRKIKALKDTPSVIVQLRLSVFVGVDEVLIGGLGACVGQTTSIDCSPRQLPLALETATKPVERGVEF